MALYTLKELNNKPAEIIRSLILEDLNSFMKIANSYMDAVIKVRESFNMLDELAVALKRNVSNSQ